MRDNLPTMLRAAANEWREKNKVVATGATRYDAALDEAADAIEELSAIREEQKAQIIIMAAEIEEQQPRWIPVTERLPKDIDEEVLVCTEDYGDNDLGFATVAVYGGSGWLECWDRKTYLPAALVTHWMPLPTPR